MSLKRHVLQVVALVTAVALVFGAFAGSAGAKKLNKSQKAKIRAELRKQVKKSPGVVKRRAFLRKAALVNFKLPVTIRLRNPCSTQNGQNPSGLNPAPGTNPSQSVLSAGCQTQGTALNQLRVPTANVNLGPSLGTRSIALSGALAAVVEFSDTYDGGALGNVNLKILPGDKTLTTSSVPLLWNTDIASPSTRSDRSFADANGAGALFDAIGKTQGCGDWTSNVGGNAATGTGTISGKYYKALFYGLPPIPQANFGFGNGNGLPGYTVYTPAGAPSWWAPRYIGADNPLNITSGGVTGNNDWIGPNSNPFPVGSAPTTAGGTPDPATTYSAANTVLRTNALSLGIAPGGVSVNMSTGTQVGATSGGLTSAQGSQDVTLGYSGGQANLFGNIPGKNVGIDVTVNLQTKINSIVRIMDQDIFKSPSLVEGESYPAGLFNCRQIVTGAVQNFIPGVRLTGSLRIAPAITKDGKVRIAKATVQSDVNNPDRVALSACLFPAKPYTRYNSSGTGTSTDTLAAKIPTAGGLGTLGTDYVTGTTSGVPALNNLPFGLDGGQWAPTSSQDDHRYPNLAEGNAPSTVRCGADTRPELADLIASSALTGTVSGLPTPTDPAYAGVTYRGDQASVAGDITVQPIDVDVLLGDQPIGT